MNHELNINPRGSVPDQLLLRNLELFPSGPGKELKFRPLSRSLLPNLLGSKRLPKSVKAEETDDIDISKKTYCFKLRCYISHN